MESCARTRRCRHSDAVSIRASAMARTRSAGSTGLLDDRPSAPGGVRTSAPGIAAPHAVTNMHAHAAAMARAAGNVMPLSFSEDGPRVLQRMVGSMPPRRGSGVAWRERPSAGTDSLMLHALRGRDKEVQRGRCTAAAPPGIRSARGAPRFRSRPDRRGGAVVMTYAGLRRAGAQLAAPESLQGHLPLRWRRPGPPSGALPAIGR
jgi:cytochrome c5